MPTINKGFKRCLPFGLLAVVLAHTGCATPVEIKNASKAQMDLINSVDSAVSDLQSTLNQFHRDKEARIIEEGRMLIARQAIDVAVENPDDVVTADQLFDSYRDGVEPWIDYAFTGPAIDERIAVFEKRMSETTDVILKTAFQMELQDLKLLKATLQNKPELITQLEAVIQDDLNKERETAEKTMEMLQLLKLQIALMKVMHGRVDAWLAIDITVNQEQVDALKDEFVSAHRKIEGGGQ
jgi:hypothetical protein